MQTSIIEGIDQSLISHNPSRHIEDTVAGLTESIGETIVKHLMRIEIHASREEL